MLNTINLSNHKKSFKKIQIDKSSFIEQCFIWGLFQVWLSERGWMQLNFRHTPISNNFKLLNKRPMGHIYSPEKKFQSINTFAQSNYQTITLTTREKKKLIECSLFVKTWVPFTQGCFVPSLVEIWPVVQEKKICI